MAVVFPETCARCGASLHGQTAHLMLDGRALCDPCFHIGDTSIVFQPRKDYDRGE